MNNDADRAMRYEGYVLDLEVEAMGLAMQARRMHTHHEVRHNAAARRAGEAGLYARKAEALRAA